MASEQEMMADLATADASGDAQLAQHIAGMIKASRQERVGGGMAALGGVAQGATLGWGDEVKAGWRSLFSKENGGKPYKEGLAEERQWNDSARAQHPYLYGGGEVVGGALPLGVGSGSKLLSLLMAAGQGVAQGAGYSNADTPRGVARDSAIGGFLGTAGYGAGEALSGAASGLARFARSRATAASAKAGEQAAGEISQAIASARGALGGEVQKGQRIVENLRRLGPELTAEEQATVAQLEQRLAQSTREALPGQAATIAAKDAELASLKSGASNALASRKAELLSTDEAKGQTLRRLLRYGPVAAGTAIGTAIGGPVGSAVGALAGAGSRPMIQSIRRLAKNPAVQKAVFDAVGNAAESKPGDLLRQLLSRGGTAAATQSLVEQ